MKLKNLAIGAVMFVAGTTFVGGGNKAFAATSISQYRAGAYEAYNHLQKEFPWADASYRNAKSDVQGAYTRVHWYDYLNGKKYQLDLDNQSVKLYGEDIADYKRLAASAEYTAQHSSNLYTVIAAENKLKSYDRTVASICDELDVISNREFHF